MSYNIYDLYQRCLEAKYTTVENNADYAIERDGTTLYLFLEWSDGAEDWKNNFRFAAKPYRDMSPKWYCHRGFLSVWKAIEPYVKDDLLDPEVTDIVIMGYSHGAAVAGIAHEWVWFNRPDIRDEHLWGYGVGAPRFFWGILTKELKERWAHFYPIRNIDDIVTHVPPVVFGYRHVHDIVAIGANGLYNCIDAHRPQMYSAELYAEYGSDEEEEI